jgi:formate hydrogenlyase subunit 4
MQYAAAVKLTMYAGLIAALLNPVDTRGDPLLAIAMSVLLMAAVAVAVGCVESLVARLRMRLVPNYLLAASLLAAAGLGVAGWIAGGGA